MKLILRDMDPDDWVLGVRAAKFLMKEDAQRKDAILTYEYDGMKDVYVKRNKTSITARSVK